jgi:hypothetical protein
LLLAGGALSNVFLRGDKLLIERGGSEGRRDHARSAAAQ